MPRSGRIICLAMLLLAMGPGCAQIPRVSDLANDAEAVASQPEEIESATTAQSVSWDADENPDDSQAESRSPEPAFDAEALPPPVAFSDFEPLTLPEVLRSVYAAYPLLESAWRSRDIAAGNHLAAHGQFDLKLKGASENGPLGFYKTYRQSVGLVQPLYAGSDVWGGYRIGRGDFQPWYLERQTNDAGEFKAGVSVPLLRNREIDERRAELWRTGLEGELAEFDIEAQIIGFEQEAAYAYWDWVAAGRGREIAQRILDLAEDRTDRIKRQVDSGLIDPPELTDNLRLVADRRAKLADATRKLEQKAAKLSLYLRDEQGNPVVPSRDRLPSFPEPQSIDPGQMEMDVQAALANRPDLKLFDTIRQQLEIDLAQACNELQPEVNAVVWGSQDVGGPSSPKRDKSPFELEAGLYVDMPLQRRKAQGKITAIEAKLQQLAAKRRLAQDKIAVDVRQAYAALTAAYEQVQQTREAVRLAEELAQRERRNFEEGASDLLKVTLREQYAAESAVKEMDANLEYHRAWADYRAALAAHPSP